MDADLILVFFLMVMVFSLWLSGVFDFYAAFAALPVSAPADVHTSLKHTDQANSTDHTKVTNLKLADRKAYVLKTLSLKPSDIKSSVVKTSGPIKSTVITPTDSKVCDPIKLQRAIHADFKPPGIQSIMAKSRTKSGYINPVDNMVVDALSEYWRACAAKAALNDAGAAAAASAADTKAASHKLTTSVSSVESFDSIASTVVATNVETTSEDPNWLSAIKLTPSDFASPAAPSTWAESDGIIYRNGHAHGVSNATHKSTVQDLQSSVRHLRKLNASISDDFSGALNVVAWEADTRVADLEALHTHALDAAQKRGNANIYLKHHEDVVASMEKKHEAAMAELRAEQKTTVWTLLKQHRTKMSLMEMAQKMEVAMIREEHRKKINAIEKKHAQDVAAIQRENVCAQAKDAHIAALEKTVAEKNTKIAAVTGELTSLQDEVELSLASMNADGERANALQRTVDEKEAEINFILSEFVEEVAAIQRSHDSDLNELEVQVTAALGSLDHDQDLTIASHESAINELEVGVTAALSSLDDDCTSTIASYESSLNHLEVEVVGSLDSLEDEYTSTIASLATRKSAENKLVYQEVASQEPVALEFAVSQCAEQESTSQELVVYEPITKGSIKQEIVGNQIDYPESGGEDFVIYSHPSSLTNSVASFETVVRHNSPSYVASPLFIDEQYRNHRTPATNLVNASPFSGVWTAHSSLQRALNTVTVVTSPPLNEQKASPLLEAASIDEAAPKRRTPSPTKQKLVTKQEWSDMVAELNGSKNLAARSADAEARRAAELAEEALELEDEEEENLEPFSSVASESTPLPSSSAAWDLSQPADDDDLNLIHENAALRTEIAALRSHITDLQITNAHNSDAYLSAKETSDHNARAADEANACFQEQTELAAALEAELDATTRERDDAQRGLQHLDRLLRNVALDTMYLRRLEWSTRKQAAHVRRLLDERVPLDNAVARLHNENLRLKQHAGEVEGSMRVVRAYAEDVAGGVLAVLRRAERQGVANVATLAERTDDEVVGGLVEYMHDFAAKANHNVRHGLRLVATNEKLLAAAAADRETINALREEVVALKDSLSDAQTDIDNATVGEELAKAELDNVNVAVARLKPEAAKVPGLERRVDDLQHALNETRVDSAPEEWQEVLEDMQMQLTAKQACLDAVTTRLTELNNIEIEHKECAERTKAVEDQTEMNRRVISALAKRNHRLVEELVLTREQAGLPKGTYLIYNFTENEFSKVVLRAMLLRVAETHKYELIEEDLEFCDELDRILNEPIVETEVVPLGREFTAAENVIGGVLDRISAVCQKVLDDGKKDGKDGKDGEAIKHRGLGEKKTIIPDISTDQSPWEPLDLSIDPEDEKEADARYEAEEERRKKAADELRAALLKADEDAQILEDESF